MRTSNAFLLIVGLTALLFSSCKNKQLEQAEKELKNSSVILQEVCDNNLMLLAKEAEVYKKARPLYEIGKDVKSVFQKVIDKDTNSADYIIKNYDSLSVRYHIPSVGIDKDISYQTAKNKLLQLEVAITTDLYKSIQGSVCTSGYEGCVINVDETTIVFAYLKDIIRNSVDVSIKPNSLTLEVFDDNNKLKRVNDVQYQIVGNYLIVKTAKLSKSLILVGGTITFLGYDEETGFSVVAGFE